MGHVQVANKPFTSSPRPLYQNEVKSSAFDMEMIFHSHANKTHLHKKGCALGLVLKVGGFWNSEVAYCIDHQHGRLVTWWETKNTSIFDLGLRSLSHSIV